MKLRDGLLLHSLGQILDGHVSKDICKDFRCPDCTEGGAYRSVCLNFMLSCLAICIESLLLTRILTVNSVTFHLTGGKRNLYIIHGRSNFGTAQKIMILEDDVWGCGWNFSDLWLKGVAHAVVLIAPAVNIQSWCETLSLKALWSRPFERIGHFNE